MKRISALLISFLLFLFSASITKAVTINIISSPSSVGSDPFNVQVYIEGPNPGTNYLRVDLFKEGSIKYFGETFNGSNWYSGSDGTQYFPITISPESTASATVQARVGDPLLSEYPGPGVYKLKIRRYTSSQSSTSSDSVDIEITVSTPTPSPTDSPTPSPTSTPTDSPTPSPGPTLTATPKPTVKSTPKPTVRSDLSDDTENGEELVLGLREELSPSPSPEEEETVEKKPIPFVAIGFILGGLVFVGVSGFLFFKSRSESYNGEHDQKGTDQEGPVETS